MALITFRAVAKSRIDQRCEEQAGCCLKNITKHLLSHSLTALADKEKGQCKREVLQYLFHALSPSLAAVQSCSVLAHCAKMTLWISNLLSEISMIT
ncbi:hypothetical protein SRHO_G00067660 [Serrasalmus rhombeus]